MPDKYIYNNVKDFILGLNNKKNGPILAVSYSGGADSGAVLDLIVRFYRDDLIPEPAVVYFNHNLRGNESGEEEKFVKSVLAGYGIKLYVIELEVSSYAEKTGLSIETAARSLRYENYDFMLNKFDYIVQGHHADDNAETVFFNIMRGAGLEGASGIKKVRGGFIRPLLDFTRREIQSYSKSRNLKYFQDSTNDKTDYSRNKIRHVIFPLIEKELNRNIANSLTGFSNSVKEALDFIDLRSEREFKSISRSFSGLAVLRYSRFIKLEPVMKKILLQKALKAAGEIYNPDRTKTDLILKGIESGRKAAFSTDEYSVSVHLDNILIMSSTLFSNPLSLTLSSKTRSPYFFDMKKVRGNIISSELRGGDTFIPFGKIKPEKVLKTLSDKKIPTALRGSLICLRDDEKIIFIQGAGISESVKADERSDIMYIVIKKDITGKLF